MTKYYFYGNTLSIGRLPRLTFSGLTYHVVNRGNNRQPVFIDDADFDKYLELLKRYKGRYGFKFYHYVLVNNHIHLLLETSEKGTVSKIMQGITLAHTRYFNRKYGNVGHVWQGRFKSPVIEKDSYLLHCGRYIELNPVRAGLVQDPGEYRWSSYRFYAYGEPNELLDTDFLYETLGENESECRVRYREFVGDGVPEETLKQIRQSITNNHILGQDSFIEQLANKFRFKKRTRRMGRPKKVSQ